MLKYKIESDIDFFSELYKSLDDEDKNTNDDAVCLISNEPLIDKFITMECGHKFNYIPLYLDIKNHKQKFNGMEGNSTHLKQNEIRCPYCRKKQTYILPYYEDLELQKIHGVNYINPNFQEKQSLYSQNYKPCKFLTPNPNYDPSGNNPEEYNSNNIGNCKFHKCFHSGTQINYYNNGSTTEGENYGDNNHYCWTHKKNVVKKYKKAILDKAKEEEKNIKQKQKEEAKKAKEDKKQKKEDAKKAKEDKQKQKDDIKKYKGFKVSSENIVLGINTITNDEPMLGCIIILKSGPNKGNKCNCKIYKENMCKRHFNSNLIIEK